jgi:3-oxoacyl-[acyl-carrier-protein] synthase-3
MVRSVKIIGTGSYLPGEPVSNDQLEKHLGGIGKYYAELITIKQRHWVKDPTTGELTEKNSDLASKAARKAVEDSGLAVNNIDMVVMTTTTPDCLCPPTVTFVQENLAIPECFAIEISTSCPGFVQGLSIAAQFIKNGELDTALVIGSEVQSFFFQPNFADNRREDIFNMFMFGDGAGAVILQGVDESDVGIGSFRVNSCGAGQKPGIILPGGTGLVRSDFLNPPRIYQDFTKVKQMGIVMLERLIEEIPRWTGLEFEAIDTIILPMELSILLELMPKLKKMKDKAFSVVSRTGYLGSAFSFVALDELNRKRCIKNGQRLLIINLDASKWIYSFMVINWG